MIPSAIRKNQTFEIQPFATPLIYRMRRYFHKHARNAGISEFIESLIQFYRSRRSKPRFFRRSVIRNAESSYRRRFITSIFENPGKDMANRSLSVRADHAEYFHFFLRRAVKIRTDCAHCLFNVFYDHEAYSGFDFFLSHGNDRPDFNGFAQKIVAVFIIAFYAKKQTVFYDFSRIVGYIVRAFG